MCTIPLFVNVYTPRDIPVLQLERTCPRVIPGSVSHVLDEWPDEDELDGQENLTQESRGRPRLDQSTRLTCAGTFG